jgi:hypothetical protein
MVDIKPGRTSRQQRAGVLLNEYNAHVESVRANTSLSTDGKRAFIAKKYLETKSALAKLKTDEVAESPARRQELRDKLFGMPKNSDPGAIIAYRDARDRAAKLSNQKEAIALANSALHSGDDQLLTAVIERSLSAHFKPIVQMAASDPEAFHRSAELAELLDYEPGFNGEDGDTRARDIFERSAAFSVSKPPELASYSDDEKVAAMVESLGEIVETSRKGPADDVVDTQAREMSENNL